MRADKYLAQAGLGTRSEIKKMIRAGRVTLDGAAVRDPGLRVPEGGDLRLDGNPVAYEAFVYYMMNKPAGIITATRDGREPTVLDLIEEPRRKDLFPVGRLDRDTEGLLLITNDGALGHRLLAPGRHVDKVYYARVRGEITQEHARLFAGGLKVDETLTAMPAELKILGLSRENGETVTEAEVTIREGKFPQVKRMFAAVGGEVLYLKRLSMGSLRLDPSLLPGEWRRLTQEELDGIIMGTGGQPS